MTGTSSVTDQLDVISKYNSLVKESVSTDSIYIRAKETVQALVSDGSLDSAQKAEIVSSIVGNAVSSITNSAMSAALEWSKAEKDIALKKLELDQQLLILEQDKILKAAQIVQMNNQTRLAKVESKRMYGTAVFDTEGNITSLGEEGKVWNDMVLVTQQTANAVIEEDLMKSKIKESQVAIHKVIADTYVNYGSYNFNQTADGVDSVVKTHGAYVTLSDTQKDIAVEQGKGYTYNAWANALTGSASMLGTALASGDFPMAANDPGGKLLQVIMDCAYSLKVASGSDAEATPSVLP